MTWLTEAANEMAELYKDEGRKIPYTPLVFEPVSVTVAPECLPQEEALLVNVC